MKDKTLQEKIKDLLFWTVVFFILYMIVAYLLESSWLKEILKLDNLYEILKDGLTISAAFLAPASAFLLFSNWREQYNAQFIDKTLIDLMIQLKDMNILLNRKGYDLKDNLFNNILKSTYEIRFDLDYTETVLKIYPKYIDEDFIENIKQFKEISKVLDDLIADISRSNQENRQYKIADDDFFDLTKRRSEKLEELTAIKTYLDDKITAIRLLLLNKT